MDKKITKDYCKNCKDNIHCCIFKDNLGFTFVGINDAKKINKFTKKEYDEFLDYSPLKSSIIKQLKNCDPSLEGAIRFSQLDNNRLLRLKTKENGYCIFLNKNKKCEIYNVRPKICKIYPFWAIKLISNKLKVISHDSEQLCPVKEYDELEVKKLYSQIVKEYFYYKKNIQNFIKLNKLN